MRLVRLKSSSGSIKTVSRQIIVSLRKVAFMVSRIKLCMIIIDPTNADLVCLNQIKNGKEISINIGT